MKMRNCDNTCRSRYTLLAVGALCILLIGSCAIPFREDGRRRAPGQDAGGVDRADPLAEPGDELIATEIDIGLRDYSQPLSDTTIAPSRPGTPNGNTAQGMGYDVQFYATLNILKARQVKQQADTLTEMPVRIVFEEPYYKVFAGPYRGFEEAEAFLRLITRLEYPNAWIVVHHANKGE